jgi:predicted dehydrogenase
MEKPLGCTVGECAALSEAARAANRVLGTALLRRFASCNRLAKQIIDSGLFGKVLSFEIHDARIFSWPIKTTLLLRPDSPGRGVLIGNGSHFFDLVLWWFGEAAEVACVADTANGGETDAKVTLEMSSGVTGTLRLSRIRQYDDLVSIRFERAIVQLPPFGSDVRITDPEGRELMGAIPRLADPKGTISVQMADLMALQIDDFVGAAMNGSEPEVGPDMATAAIALVERCARAIEVSDFPWTLRRALPNGLVAAVREASIFHRERVEQ